MSLSATASAAAASASSAVSFHPHGHKGGVHNDPNTESSSPATTEGLFSSLLSSLAQVAVGTNPIASAAISAFTPAAPASSVASITGTTSADGFGTSGNGAQVLSALGGNVNARV